MKNGLRKNSNSTNKKVKRFFVNVIISTVIISLLRRNTMCFFCRTCSQCLLLSEKKKEKYDFIESYVSVTQSRTTIARFSNQKNITIAGIQITYLSSVNAILTKQEKRAYSSGPEYHIIRSLKAVFSSLREKSRFKIHLRHIDITHCYDMTLFQKGSL